MKLGQSVCQPFEAPYNNWQKKNKSTNQYN